LTKTFVINGRKIDTSEPPYVIAELSANHNGSIKRAKEIISSAKKSGADAVKIQTYRPEIITLKSNAPDFRIDEGLWAGKSLFELYESAFLPWEWHANLFEYAKEIGITIFSSPFDNSAVDLLEDLNAPAYKIASFEAIDLELIKYVASTRKPLIISTGMADFDEIREALEAAHEAGASSVALLHCVSGYPAPAEDYNLKTITDMKKQFGVPVGISDHTLDNATAIAAVALGATIIEKHVTLDRQGGGPDDTFSLEPQELSVLCRDARTAWSALGRVSYEKKPSELGNIKFRRSLYFVGELKAGQLIEPEHIRSIRPGFGLAPKHYSEVIGKKVKRQVVRGDRVSWDILTE